MFRKIITKLKLGSCKTKVLDDVNAFEESEKKETQEGRCIKWNTIVKTVIFIGKEIQILLEKCLFMKRLT